MKITSRLSIVIIGLFTITNVIALPGTPKTTTNPSLTVSPAPTNGKITADSNIDCSGDIANITSTKCDTTAYATGASVTLTAIPNAQGATIAWGGDCSGNSTTCSLTMNTSKSVTVTFTPPVATTYNVILNKTGTGSGTHGAIGPYSSGTVSSGSSAGKYPSGFPVSLIAAPDANSTFDGWSPSPCANSFVMPSQDLTCTATFTLKQTATNCNSVTEIPVSECQSLMDLYNSTNGANWTNKTGWNQTNTPCSWHGVTCNGGHVYDLNFNNNKLSGNIPNLNLPYLLYLQLYNNQLSGSIPNFSNLPKLQGLYLYNNQLSGNIPNFSNLPYLTGLYLYDNQLSGNIPNFNLPYLLYLQLYNNQLSGNIPSLSNLPKLAWVILYNNQLSGNIPNFNLHYLQILYLDNNQLSGSIPNFTNLPNLTELALSSNQLSGSIPNFNSFNLANLRTAIFTKNCGLTAYDSNQEVILNQKDSVWKTQNTNCPVVSNNICNSVTEIPVSECQSLMDLYNSTNGTNWTNKTGWNQTNTPCSWYGIVCDGGRVTQISLPSNNLIGSLPNLILPNLKVLDLYSNQLSGSIPDFANLPKLVGIFLYSNQLNGNIPNFTLPNLQGLYLYNNQLTGSIPNFTLPNLKVLDLYSNQLSGSVPNFASFNLANLYEAKLYNNCGLVAYDSNQEVILNQKDSIWKTQNTNCPAMPNLSNGLVAYYCFDDPNNIGKDCSAYNNIGTPSGGVSAITNGVKGGAVNFGGVTNQGSIHIPNSPSLNFDRYLTASFFVKLNSEEGMDGYGNTSAVGAHNIFSKDHDSSGFYSTVVSSNGNVTGWLGNSQPNFGITGTKQYSLLQNWLHVAYVFSKDTGTAQTYFNGELVKEETGKSIDFSIANTRDLYLGKYRDSWYPLNGMLDEVRFYNRALSASEIKQLATTDIPNVYSLSLISSDSGGIVSGGGSFAAGATVNLTASSDVSWSPSPCASSFVMPANDLVCTATFANTKPIGPSSMSASVLADRITLNWTDSSNNEAGFNVYRYSNNMWVKIATVPANTTTYTDKALPYSSNKYIYAVEAFNDFGTGWLNNGGGFITKKTPLPNMYLAPVAPKEMSKSVSNTSVTLNWSDDSDNENGFNIYRHNGSVWVKIGTVSENITSFTDKGLQPNSTYYYAVEAFNNAGKTWTTKGAGFISAKTSSNYNTAYSYPAGPSAMSIPVVSSNSITLNWTDSASNENSFNIYRYNGAGWVKIATVSENIVSYTDTNLKPNTTYIYAVESHNNVGASWNTFGAGFIITTTTMNPYKQPDWTVKPTAPTSMFATAISSNSITFNWSDDSDNENGFNIYRHNGAGWVKIVTTSENVTSYTDTGLQPNSSYIYAVEAYNGMGVSWNTFGAGFIIATTSW